MQVKYTGTRHAARCVRMDMKVGGEMGLVERFDRKLESTVEDAFARIFGGAVVSEDVADMLRREAADEVRTLPGGHRLAPNEYVITLSSSDHEKVLADADLTADTFAKHLAGYIGEQGWQTYGEVVVRFEQSPALHTGQVRARGAVNPDATPAAALGSDPEPEPEPPAPRQSALTAEPGVSAMSDNPNYRGGQGQGQDRPGDDNYDDRYGRQQDDQRGQDPRNQDRSPDQRGQDPRYGDQRGYQQDQPTYQQRPGYPDQGGYQQGYEQRPPAGYGDQQGRGGYDPGYRQGQGGYGGPQGGSYGDQQPRGDYDYGRGGQRPDDYGRQSYPDQGGYGRQDYGRQDYGQQPDYGRYQDGPGGNYGDQQRGDYDYGQQQSGQASFGGGGYDQGYRPTGGAAAVTLQLDDGSGRTYQLREGANVIGRGQDAQFRLPDTGVSRRHLEIRWDGQVALLSDLNSTNGTTVNNAPVQEWQLADGDVIRLGHSEIVVRVH